MSDSLSSLLNFLDAPLMIGDPEGRVIWVNPAFEQTFTCDGEYVRGQALAALFDGGGREAVLGAVAEVCTRGETVRFRLKKDDVGFLGGQPQRRSRRTRRRRGHRRSGSR